MKQRVFWELWPAFLVAAVANAIFFSFFDPLDLMPFGRPLELSPIAVYSSGFLCAWCVLSISGALTVFLARSPCEVNRCPMPREERPQHCRDLPSRT